MTSVKSRRMNKMRTRARSIVRKQIGTDVFEAAQGFMCPICSRPLNDKSPWHKLDEDSTSSVDHVYHLQRHERHEGNLLLTHRVCNMKKGDRHPTREEQQMLGLVNRCLGYRKGVYKAAKLWKGVKLEPIPEPDFYRFCLEIIDYVKLKIAGL